MEIEKEQQKGGQKCKDSKVVSKVESRRVVSRAVVVSRRQQTDGQQGGGNR